MKIYLIFKIFFFLIDLYPPLLGHLFLSLEVSMSHQKLPLNQPCSRALEISFNLQFDEFIHNKVTGLGFHR